MGKNKMFLLALGLPIIVLLGMTIKPLQATYLGESIKLQTAPVDPRDLFYGDYVILDFEIERVDFELLSEELSSQFELENDRLYYKGREHKLDVYVLLEEVDEVHEAKYVTNQKPSDGIFVKGNLKPYLTRDNKVGLEFPIKRYYLEEGTGKQLEKDAREGRIIADLKVYKGYSILKNINVK